MCLITYYFTKYFFKICITYAFLLSILKFIKQKLFSFILLLWPSFTLSAQIVYERLFLWVQFISIWKLSYWHAEAEEEREEEEKSSWQKDWRLCLKRTSHQICSFWIEFVQRGDFTGPCIVGKWRITIILKLNHYIYIPAVILKQLSGNKTNQDNKKAGLITFQEGSKFVAYNCTTWFCQLHLKDLKG